MDDNLLSGLGDVSRGTWADAIAFVQNSEFREIAFATFALQAKLMGADPVISRCVNIAIHGSNAVLVMFVVKRIAYRAGYRTEASGIACIVAVLWVVLPVHATTVLYPIQRMTLLAATGSLVVFAFVLGKQTAGRVALACFAYAIAILAKETALLAMPAAWILRGLLSDTPSTRLRVYQSLALLSAALVASLLLFNVQLESPLNYSAWDFSLFEHTLVAPRILADYAISVLIPVPNHFSFYYDDFLATSARPFSSLYLVPLIFAPSVFLVLWFISQRNRLAAAGLAFFVLLHTLEGAALALDLYFEHRNYLPSLGLVLALVATVMPVDKSPVRGTAKLFTAYFVMLLGVLAFRSHLIGDELALTRHHLAEHPTSFRSILDAAYFGVAIDPQILARYPFPIELESIALRAKCAGTDLPFAWKAPAVMGPVPKRSLRLHVDTLDACADPCAVDDAYLNLLTTTFLEARRADGYRVSFAEPLARFTARRRAASCP